MSKEIAVTPRMAEVSPEYQEILMLGNVLFQSGYFKDVKDQAQAVTKILLGRELGFSPIVSMTGIHVIEGRPTLSSNLMATLIKRSGKYDYRVKTWTHTECVIVFRQRDGGQWEEVGESSFTMDDAKAAGVLRTGGNWSKWPRAMLFARALSQGLRTYCPDVSASPIYNPEEMGAEVNGEGEVTQLPKSARNVQITTEDIELEPPKSAPANSGQGESVLQRGNDSPASAETSARLPVKAQAVVDTPVPSPTSTVETPGLAAIPIPGADCIGTGEAANLHREFRNTLPKKFQKDADALLSDWLRVQTPPIVDVLGKPSALAIKKESFYDIRTAVCDYARTFAV